MALILEYTDSAYFPCFKTMFKNVVTALAESRDITLYLSPLTKHFIQFEETDFSECKPLIKPLLHVVCLVSIIKFFLHTISIFFDCLINVTFVILALGKFKLLSHIFKTYCSSQANRKSYYTPSKTIFRPVLNFPQRH